MTKELTNSVRQVLMNELGLTRDVVREEVRAIVKETVDRYFASGEVEKFVAPFISDIYKRDSYVLRERICQVIGNRIGLSITVKDDK